MDVTRDTIKRQSDFASRNDFVDYLFDLCEIGLSRDLIYGRIGRNYHPYDAITTRKVKKPGRNHPYKKQFRQRLEMEKQND